jgi:hypothetical protein
MEFNLAVTEVDQGIIRFNLLQGEGNATSDWSYIISGNTVRFILPNLGTTYKLEVIIPAGAISLEQGATNSGINVIYSFTNGT